MPRLMPPEGSAFMLICAFARMAATPPEVLAPAPAPLEQLLHAAPCGGMLLCSPPSSIPLR